MQRTLEEDCGKVDGLFGKKGDVKTKKKRDNRYFDKKRTQQNFDNEIDFCNHNHKNNKALQKKKKDKKKKKKNYTRSCRLGRRERQEGIAINSL